MRTIYCLIAACALFSSGCSSTSADEQITVLAAASLQDVFEAAGEDFTEQTGVEVTFSFAGSQSLVTQLAEGSPGDVLATANEKTMDQARADGTVTDPLPFATNTLTLAVAPGNPKNVQGLDDLTRTDLLFVRCAEAVPCGTASDKVLADLQTTPVSEENSVTDVLGKVTSGQADVGLVYSTDVTRSQGAAEAVDFPEAEIALNTYPIAVTTQSGSASAQRFVDHVTGPEGQRLLQEAGFGAP